MAFRSAFKRAWYKIFRRPPEEIVDSILPIGRVLISLLPADRLSTLRRTLLVSDPERGLADRLVHREMMRRYYESTEGDQREENRSLIWGADAGVEWHEGMRRLYSDPARFGAEYLGRRMSAVRQLQSLAESDRFLELCEIGTGNGMFLEYLSRELRGIEHFVGIDLSAEQIAINRAAYEATALEFLHVEAKEYVDGHRDKPTIFVSAGTLEYFTADELDELLRALRNRRAATAVTLIEPVSLDLENEPTSRPRGGMSFSHNYPHLLRLAGFDLREIDLQPIQGSEPDARQISLTATLT